MLKYYPNIIPCAYLYKKKSHAGEIASVMSFLSLSHSSLSVFSSVCLSKSFTAFGSRISSSRAPLPSLYPRQLFPSFLLISGTSHSSTRFVSPSLVVSSPVCFPALYLAPASSLSPPPSPSPFFLATSAQNIFPRNVRVHLLQVTSLRSIGRVPTGEIRICPLHTFTICEIAFAPLHTSLHDDHSRRP